MLHFIVFLAWLGHLTPKEHHTSALEEDYFYLASVNDEDFEEEFLTIAYYTCRATSVLAIVATCPRDTLLAYQYCKERQLLQDNVCNMTL